MHVIKFVWFSSVNLPFIVVGKVGSQLRTYMDLGKMIFPLPQTQDGNCVPGIGRPGPFRRHNHWSEYLVEPTILRGD